MPRLHTNDRLSLFVWSIILLVLIAPLLGLGIFASGAAPLVYLPMVLTLVLPLSLLLGISRVLLRQDRTIRAAACNDNQRAPMVIAPPNPAEALAPGATLQMTRIAPPSAIINAGVGTLVVAVIIIAFTELLVALAFAPLLPALGLNGVNGELPGWVIWFFALMPVVVWGGFAAYQYVILARDKDVTISADDQGITLKQNTRRPQFIPWNDIHGWIRGTGSSSDPTLSSYVLVGYHHRLIFQLNSIFNLRAPLAKSALGITYVGGIAQYQAQARQLLATIAARSQVPLRTFPQGFYGPSGRRLYPFAQLTTSDIAALPVAHPALLPSLPAVQAMYMHPGPLALPQRNKLPVNMIAVGILIGIAVLLFVVTLPLEVITQDYTLIAINILPVIVIIAIILVRLRYSFNAMLRVDAQGIRGNVLNRQIVIPWQRVRYWVVEPPTSAHPNELVYGLFSDGPTLTWRVPIILGNDPQSFAQRANIEAFHAMIAARTGQPPRQLPVR